MTTTHTHDHDDLPGSSAAGPSAAAGKAYWRSLEELADTPAFRAAVAREFPHQAGELDDPVDRRRFLQLMGASLALAGLTGCTRQPEEKVLPYVRPVEELVPGKPLFFATAMPLGAGTSGLLVESHEGRPTKIEGNPDHPASLGATDPFAQASVLTLYDPDRSQTVTYRGEIRPWSAFLGALSVPLERQRQSRGAGLRLLTETVLSPTLADQLRRLLAAFPNARWHPHDPAGPDGVRAGARLAFGEDVGVVYRFETADVILSLDADFLSCGPGHVRYAREFARRRRLDEANGPMSRLYAFESTPTITGAAADHRWPVPAGQVEAVARTLAAKLGVKGVDPSSLPPSIDPRALDALARDLRGRRGASLVVAGDGQPPVVQALAHAINDALGNTGRTVVYTEPVEAQPVDQTASLRALADDMEAGRVEVLVVLSANPVYTAPADLAFAARMEKVGLRVRLGLYQDETSALCHWHVPEAHYLESWGDARAYDGTVSLIQPLIAPLYNGKTAYEVLGVLLGELEGSSYDIVRGYWRGRLATGAGAADPEGAAAEFERAWRRALHTGFIPGTASPPRPVALRADWPAAPAGPVAGAGPSGLEINFRLDPCVLDGRFANNGWLQELPKPLTKITWDNVALLSPNTAERLGLGQKAGLRGGDFETERVDLVYRGRTVRAPVWVLPGQPDDTVTVHLGYGRTRAGRVGTRVGFNAYALQTSDALGFGRGLEVRKTGETYTVACTQLHHALEGRDLVRSGTLAEYRQHPSLAPPSEHAPSGHGRPSLYPEYKYEGYAWGMAIDINACIGCNACVVACQSENNIPVVGKDQVARGREMHWLRIDHYYKGEPANPESYFQPLPCMHCEKAPCEVVCPVNATVHSAEGLNDMVYNRCVGTRYCSNNCPYKVRRFNFFLYQDWTTPTLKLMRNPDVTVRSRGVMEKCTYCVQRINSARIEAEKEDRAVADGVIVTACQATCPADAIVFGNINDPGSRVSRLKAEPRNYGLLAELNTQPRTTYLGAVRNPNPEIGRT